MSDFLKGTTGKWSANRIVLLGAAGLIGLAWLGVQVGIAFADWQWDAFAGAFTWGRDFLFVSVLPYLGNKAKEAVGK